jgi:DNA repair protein RadA/Sms
LSKVRKVFICSSCGAQSPKWTGKCPSCGEWNTYQEEVLQRDTSAEPGRNAWKNGTPHEVLPQPIALPDIQSNDTPRLVTSDDELNRVLGGGIVRGSLVLIGGQPGIGKSTLLLQLALQINAKVIYF